MTHWTNLIWRGCSMSTRVYLYSEYLQSNTFSEVQSHITHLCVVWINIKLTMSRNPSTSLRFQVCHSPACVFPRVKSLSVIVYLSHGLECIVKHTCLFLISGALTFHPKCCSSAVEGPQGYTENVTVVSTRLFTSRVNTCCVFFKMAPETHF